MDGNRKRDHVLLRPDGLYNVYLGEEAGVEKTENALPLLREDIEIDPGVTVGDVFRLVRGNQALRDFIAPYTHCSGLDEHFAELDNPTPNDDPLDYAEIYWYAGMLHEEDERPKLELKAFFHGFGKGADGEPKEVPYSLIGCPIDHLAPLPLRLNFDLDLTVWDEKGKPKGGGMKLVRDFTLLEVLEAIFWEISWFGPPPMKYKALDPDPEKEVDDPK